jgi:hypothetical protein
VKSSIWTAWCQKNDVYICDSGAGDVHKISLHESGTCKFSLTGEFMKKDPPVPKNNRNILTWNRNDYSSIDHSNALKIFFILVNGGVEVAARTDELYLLPDAPTGFSTEVAIFFSKTDPRTWKSNIWLTSNLMKTFRLLNGDYVAFRRRVYPLPDEQFQRVLRIQHQTSNSIFIGEESSKSISGGLATMVLCEATENLGILYVLEKVDLSGSLGHQMSWSVPRKNQ